MASTIALRRRIKTAQNISKTTRAMQMIAASRLKKAQDAVTSSRPYVEKLSYISQTLFSRMGSAAHNIHPYLRAPKKDHTLYIIISPDKGLCGGLVTNILREYLKRKHESQAYFITIGKKIEGHVSNTTKNLVASFPFGLTIPSFEQVGPISELINEYFLSGKVDRVQIITTHFVSVFSQSPTITSLLPLTGEVTPEKTQTQKETLFEPSTKTLLPALLKRYIDMVLYQSLLEAYASEQASRMIAMQNATNNAKDIVNALTLVYNKARQERITKEILDISSASVALEQQV